MDYIEWCATILRKIVELANRDTQARMLGSSDRDVAWAVFGDAASQGAFWGSQEQEGTLDALRDLSAIGLTTSADSEFWKPTDVGRAYLSDPIPSWESICQIPLDVKQEELLRAVNRLSPRTFDRFAKLDDLSGDPFIVEIPWAKDIGLLGTVATELKDRGLADGQLYMGNHPSSMVIHATLAELIWETRRKFTQQSREIDRLVAEWETTSVDFKMDVHLDTKDQEAEFTKDVLGLANTQASGPRRLVIGFHPKTHAYVNGPNAVLNQDRIERILINNTEPMVQARYEIVDYRLGPVGTIEVMRDPMQIPYKVKRSLGDRKRITEGQVFVRHGSQTEEPTPAELVAALLRENSRARGEPEDPAE